MMQHFKIKQKILFYVLSVTALVFIFTVSYIGLNSRRQIEETSRELANSYAREYAKLSQDKLNTFMDATRFLRQTFENFRTIPEEERRNVLSEMLVHLLRENTDFLSVWSILNPGSIDSLDEMYVNQPGSTILGNFRYIYYRENNRIQLSGYIEQDPNEVMSGFIYNTVKSRLKETVIEPEMYSYSGNKDDEVLQTSMVAPVLNRKQFIGVIGVDVPLASLQKMIDAYKPVEGSFAFLMSHAQQLVTYPEKGLIGKSYLETGLLPEDMKLISESIEAGGSFSFDARYVDGTWYYLSFAPVEIGFTGTPWYVGFAFPHQVMLKSASRTLNVAILVGLAGLLIIGLVIWYLAGSISNPLEKLTEAIKKIGSGNVSKSIKLKTDGGDEIAEMSMALNEYIDGYLAKSEFATKIGEGNLDVKLERFHEEDQLAQALIHMKESLKKAREEDEKRRMDDEKRRWTNEGLSKFADILRQDNDNLENLSYQIIKNLALYLDANQGGIFLLNDENTEDTFLELKAAFAYNRRKYMERMVKFGEGLVGTCAIEKESIYLTDIPQDYLEVTSGLGDANPDCLLLVPLKIEDDVFGVLEIASFHRIEPYQIEFVERVGLSIASALKSIRVSLKTSELLERSQQQAEEMRAQEEEMRQNMEELSATQEAMAEKEEDSQRLIKELKEELARKEEEISEMKKRLA
jgi:methyl-accepting chemotaxis protein